LPDTIQGSELPLSAALSSDPAAAVSEFSILVKARMKLLLPQPLAPQTSKLTGVVMGRMLSLGLMDVMLLCCDLQGV
jgi:hypothetical protein